MSDGFKKSQIIHSIRTIRRSISYLEWQPQATGLVSLFIAGAAFPIKYDTAFYFATRPVQTLTYGSVKNNFIPAINSVCLERA